MFNNCPPSPLNDVALIIPLDEYAVIAAPIKTSPVNVDTPTDSSPPYI